jgi:hypothetical protein
MKLLTEDIRNHLPKLYANEHLGLQANALVHYFAESRDWYASEFDGIDTFFGLVRGFEIELGYFSLSELESLRIPNKIHLPSRKVGVFYTGVERDLYWTPKTLQEIWDELTTQRNRRVA